MKKTLAIVLALVMVLCMIPAMSADTYTVKTVADKNYSLQVESIGTCKKADGTVYTNTAATATKANSITYEYNFEEEQADLTGKWTENTKMALVSIIGLDAELVNDITVTIDGKKLESPIAGVGFVKTTIDSKDVNVVRFPVELTKAGYSDTYLVQVTGKNAGKDVVVTETAKVSVKLVNTAAYKDAKTANILDVESSDKKSLDAYIVGSKLYLDFVDEAAAGKMGETIAITFGDENKKAFTGNTWAYKPTNMDIANATYNNFGDAKWGSKLKDSTAEYFFADINAANGVKVSFPLETASALYATKEYTVVIRKGIKVSDPKGVIFQDSTKTIAMGETYAPKLVGVANGKVLTPDALYYGTNTSEQVIDIDGVKVIGTREGVAYITASYKADKTGTAYTSNSMKIVVTTGESIPPVVKTEVYYVTCRNLNVRKGAGTSYAKAGMIHRGDAVEVVEIKGGWAKLANGTYVCAKYIAK